ncbi:hypothetical protein J437_LFUL012602 [Ladona fulva]|uniref:Timeless n=1 Tax=Ladona fulva TaxID=123851 RepID=A0A8K0P4C9_LADFU|nr:hypothetical protein J437_LFUL012602 [Ladona fulva]
MCYILAPMNLIINFFAPKDYTSNQKDISEYVKGSLLCAHISLGEILSYLTTEDKTMRNFRRALGVSQLIQTDLIPLLIHAKDDMKIMDATIRVLVNLTLPVECLLSLETLSQTKCGRQTISDLNHLLEIVKQAFVDPRVTSCLIQRMRSTIDMGRKLLAEECESIGNCLLLLRNILHIPDNKMNKTHSKPWHPAIDSNGNGASCGTSNQNLILWNIFAQNIDKVLLHLMTCPQRAEWDVPMVQLVALTYKDQHMASLLKMLQLWLETSMSSESSEDNESNTSPQPLSQGSENSSPVLTSEATSDSSDNGGAANEGGKKLQKGERSKGACEEDEESVQHALIIPSMNSLDDKHKDCKSNQESSQSCAADQEKNKQKENVNDGKVEKHSAEGKEQDCQKKKDLKPKKVEEEENINTDKDSGVFSQDSSHNWNSDKKGHMPSHQRHYHHQHHPHRYPHHHRSHVSHSTNKKDSTGASSTSINHPKGNAVSELSDCGYSTQRENQPESLSTSSNEDEGPIAKRSMKPGHQKHHLRQHHKLDSNKLTNANCGHPVKVQKSNLRRKRLVKRIHSANVKGVLHHIPTDDDISNLLKEFTLDFLLQGYGPLVSGLHMKLLSCCTHRAPGVHPSSTASIICSKPSLLPSSPTIRSPSPDLPPPPIDTSHFFWLITFFLRFSSQLELELEHISMVLSYDILSYLVYEGVGLCEEVELAMLHCQEFDVKPCLRRIHLVVTAIREFVQAVESYEKMAMNIPGREGDRVYLEMLKRQMAATRDLRCLFVLLLQHYNPSVMSKQYLQDVVVTNHVLLLFLEGGNGINSSSNNDNCNRRVGRRNSLLEEVDMMDHIQHFANRGIVQKYGQLLAAFQENGEFVNDCVFTMLHHIGGGEVNRPETLFQPTLLRAFSAMWESDFDICDDWSDLIEYIIHKFISNPQHGMSPKNPGIGIIPLGLPSGGNTLVSDKKELEESENKWTMEDLRDLRWFYAQSCRENNFLAKIVKLYRQKSGVTKSRDEVLNQLLSQKIIDSNQYASLKRSELPGEVEDKFVKPFSPPTPVSIQENFNGAENWDSEDVNEISKLKVNLINEGLEKEIHWLQGALLEACYVKLWMKKRKEGASYDSTHFHVMEPVPYHYALMGQPIPIIPWGIEEQRAVIQNTTFCQLLHCLGIQKPREDGIGGIYPRIPISFTPLDLLEAAKKLGDLTTGNMKFDPAELNPMELEEEMGENFKVPSEALHRNPDNKSPVHFHNTPPQLSPQPARCSLQKSPSEINIMATGIDTEKANSNINWLSIVGRSKNLSLIEKLPLKKETEENEEDCNEEERGTNIPPKEEHCLVGTGA